MNEQDAPDPEDPRRELVLAYRECTAKCRKWLRKLADHDYNPYAAGRALGFAKQSVWTWLNKPAVQKIMDIRCREAANELGFSDLSILRGYLREERADIRKLFDKENGKLLPPALWPDEVALCVTEYGYDKNGLPFVKIADQRSSRDRLAKFQKLLVDRHEHTGKDGKELPGGAVPVVNVYVGQEGA